MLHGMYSDQKAVHIPRCEGHPDLHDQDLGPIRTLVGLPLIHEDQVVGSLGGGSFGSQGYIVLSDERFWALESLAEAAGLVMNRLRNRRAMAAEEARFRLLFEQSPDPILLISDGRIEDVNASASRLFGLDRTAMLGRSMAACSPEFQPEGGSSAATSRERLDGALLGTHQWFEWTFLGAGEREVVCQVNLTRLDHGDQPIIHAIVRDLTAQKQAEVERAALERQLFQAQKMESLGVLAGGIAHDFNNLLTAIRGNAELMSHRVRKDPAMTAEVDEILHAADRAATLTRQLLAFSRKQVLQPVPLDLNEIVGTVARMARRLIGTDVRLRLDLAPRVAQIVADPAQIEQVLLNLIVNARDAMPSGGRIHLTTTDVRLDAEQADAIQTGLAAGPYVLLNVTDDGIGMDQATQARIFEPFFTTKETGRGTGLGLSTVYGIVSQTGGAITVVSERDQGASFRVYLPAATGAMP
jgi:PAS domain S-box-containing protein